MTQVHMGRATAQEVQTVLQAQGLTATVGEVVYDEAGGLVVELVGPLAEKAREVLEATRRAVSAAHSALAAPAPIATGIQGLFDLVRAFNAAWHAVAHAGFLHSQVHAFLATSGILHVTVQYAVGQDPRVEYLRECVRAFNVGLQHMRDDGYQINPYRTPALQFITGDVAPPRVAELSVRVWERREITDARA